MINKKLINILINLHLFIRCILKNRHLIYSIKIQKSLNDNDYAI